MRAERAMAGTRLGFAIAAGLLGNGAMLLLFGVVHLFGNTDGAGSFGVDAPWAWTGIVVPLLAVSAVVLALANVALSHRIVTGNDFTWWQYLLGLIPCVQIFVLFGALRRIRKASPDDRTRRRLDNASAFIILATVANSVIVRDYEIPWRDLEGPFPATRANEILRAAQALVEIGAWSYVVAVLPIGPRSVGRDGDVEWAGSAGPG